MDTFNLGADGGLTFLFAQDTTPPSITAPSSVSAEATGEFTAVTEFQFKVAALNFHSEAYEWLVVAGARAQYKGIGTINGAGNYGFMLTAIDGAMPGGGGNDRFRIKIWDKNNNGIIVYDNQPGESDSADLSIAVQGGSIVIHHDR